MYRDIKLYLDFTTNITYLVLLIVYFHYRILNTLLYQVKYLIRVEERDININNNSRKILMC